MRVLSVLKPVLTMDGPQVMARSDVLRLLTILVIMPLVLPSTLDSFGSAAESDGSSSVSYG